LERQRPKHALTNNKQYNKQETRKRQKTRLNNINTHSSRQLGIGLNVVRCGFDLIVEFFNFTLLDKCIASNDRVFSIASAAHPACTPQASGLAREHCCNSNSESEFNKVKRTTYGKRQLDNKRSLKMVLVALPFQPSTLTFRCAARCQFAFRCRLFFLSRSNSSNNLLRTFCFGLAKDETRQTVVLVAQARVCSTLTTTSDA
jgi:hypothetical protein